MGRLTLPTVESRFDERENGITPLRLLLAIGVVLFHVWPIGGFGEDPLTLATGGQEKGAGRVAVLAFFALSGFLLASSRLRLSRPAFLWRRFLRIYPAYLACIVLTAMFVGPAYVLSTWLIGPFVDTPSSSLFASNPAGPKINGSIWTLWPEVLCYGLLVALPKRRLQALGGVFLAGAVAMYLVDPQPMYQLAAAFFAGVTLRLVPTIPLHGSVVVVLLACLAAATAVGHYAIAEAVVIGYVALWAAVRLPARFATDWSYGTYIYAFPVSQALVALGVNDAGPVVFATACLAMTLPIAAASWYFVERPALRAKNVSIIRPAVDAIQRRLPYWRRVTASIATVID